MAPHSSTLAWKVPWTRSLVGCSPWGCEELDTTERLHFHFSLSCIGEGNGSPPQCSCLENPRDGGAWWAAVYVCHSLSSKEQVSFNFTTAFTIHSDLEPEKIKSVTVFIVYPSVCCEVMGPNAMILVF